MVCPNCQQDWPSGMKPGYEESCPNCGSRVRIPGEGEEPTIVEVPPVEETRPTEGVAESPAPTEDAEAD